MRKTMWQIPLAVALALCIAGAPATASKGRVAKATYAYDASRGGSIFVNDETVALTAGDTVTFETMRTDKAMQLVVTDDSAASVSVAVWQEDTSTTVFCNELASLPVVGGQPVYVRVIVDVQPATGGGCASPEMPTTGTLTATFAGAGKHKGGGHHHHH